jgi:hypothetical protein
MYRTGTHALTPGGPAAIAARAYFYFWRFS